LKLNRKRTYERGKTNRRKKKKIEKKEEKKEEKKRKKGPFFPQGTILENYGYMSTTPALNSCRPKTVVAISGGFQDIIIFR
jgi:hypothetical protein